MASQPKSKTLLSAGGLGSEAPVHIPPATGRMPKLTTKPFVASQRSAPKDYPTEAPSLANAPASAGATPTPSPPATPTPCEVATEMRKFMTPPSKYRGVLSPMSILAAQSTQSTPMPPPQDLDIVGSNSENDDAHKNQSANVVEQEARVVFQALAKTDEQRAEDPSQATQHVRPMGSDNPS